MCTQPNCRKDAEELLELLHGSSFLFCHCPICSVPADYAVNICFHTLKSGRICIRIDRGEQQDLWKLGIQDRCHLAEQLCAFLFIECVGAVDQLVKSWIEP